MTDLDPAGQDRGDPGAGDLVPSFVPALVVLLVASERDKGAPLTRAEVEDIRDSGTCVMVRRSIDEQLAAERGYPDLDPEDVWDEWLRARPALGLFDVPPPG